MSKRIAVMGCGALGGYVGGYLTREGLDITMIDPWPDHVAAMRDPGLKLEGVTDEECFDVKCNTVLQSELPPPGDIGPFDIVIIAVKSYDTKAAAELMKPYLADDGFAVSLQNGINEHLIAEVLGADRTVGCIASQISLSLPGPGHIQRKIKKGGDQHTVFRVGEIDGAVTPRVQDVADMLSVIDSTRATDNLMGERWSKLAANAMRNPVSAATQQGANTNDKDEHMRRITIGLAAEAIQVACAEGAKLVKIMGLEPDALLGAANGDADATKVVLDKFYSDMERRKDSQRPSMAQDVEKGRPTEIDHINGLVADRGALHGIATPLNSGIRSVIKAIEAGTVKPGPETLRDL
ncbi:MAG: ketopantoate reductase family protein [Rhodospirillales bacterium]|nr:ketopantoate reductase family protein [Rhodospirillales bacterium]MBO6787062.1 ketopantoate reductase family protein [Rhodospirillales bacterium]